MEVEGGERAPGISDWRTVWSELPGVPRQLHRARLEHQPEQEPPDEKNRQSRWMTIFEVSRSHSEWGQEDRDKASFQQQNVPLKAQEILAHVDEQQVAQPENDQHRDGQH